jgi:hypothetical protein
MGESDAEEGEDQPYRVRPQTGPARLEERKSVRGSSVLKKSERGKSVARIYELLLQQRRRRGAVPKPA